MMDAHTYHAHAHKGRSRAINTPTPPAVLTRQCRADARSSSPSHARARVADASSHRAPVAFYFASPRARVRADDRGASATRAMAEVRAVDEAMGANADADADADAARDAGADDADAIVDDAFTLKFLISPSAAGSVIGKGGATINEFQALTGARVQLSRSREVFPGTNDRVVIVSGDLNAILQVLYLILTKLVADGEGIDRSGTPQLALVVPNGCCGCVIGKGGSKIRNFVEDSQADIKLSNQDRMLPGCNDRTLTITGAMDSVLRAVALVATTLCEDPSYATLVHRQSTYSVQAPLGARIGGGRRSGDHGRSVSGSSRRGGDDETSILVTIPDSLIGAVLGRGGRTIAEVQVASGCRIKVSARDDFFEGTRNRKVVITGSQEGVQMANYLLTQKLSAIVGGSTEGGGFPDSNPAL